MEWEELVDGCRRKHPVLRPAAVPGRFSALWSRWELDAICRFTPVMESPTFRLFRNGKQVPPAVYVDRRGAPSLASLRQLWASGVSINFARLELYSNPILAAIRGLEAALHCPMQAHFFTTPPQAQGLGVHADDIDVLILQLEGEKTWDVYLDTPRWSPGAPGTKVALEGQKPTTVTLAAGGWLYLPTGVYHEVRNRGDAPTTHVGIGSHRLTWATLLERALKLAGGKVPELDAAVPVAAGWTSRESDTAPRLAAVQPYLDAALAAEQYGQSLPPEAQAPRAALEAADLSTLFSWRTGTVNVRTVAERVELHVPYRSEPVRLRADLASVVEAMATRERFTAADLPLEAESAVLLAKFLANLGVVGLAQR